MKCLYNGIILKDGKKIKGKALLYKDVIVGIVDIKEAFSKTRKRIDVKGSYIAPGFIDIHIHGYNGADTMDASVKAIEIIAKGIAANGVTSFLPTTMTMERQKITASIESIRRAMKKPVKGAEVLGVHMEGPFLNIAFKGAQNEAYLQVPDIRYIKENEDVIRHVTIAPEINGAIEFIKEIHQNTDISLSMGHSGATFEQAKDGIRYGISHVTHLFNGMSGLHHRDPGVVGAALVSDVSCEIICDTIHIHSSLFQLLSKIKDDDQLILVTDCMRAGGKEEGIYSLGGQKVIVKDGQARLENGNLAASILKLNDGLRNIISHTTIPIEKAIKYVTINPAKVIGLEDKKGTLDDGKDADITVFNKGLTIQMTIGKGEDIYNIINRSFKTINNVVTSS